MCNYIKKIEISGLWGELCLEWRLDRDVNILSGLNGSGKSTIIRSLVELFRNYKLSEESRKRLDNIEITFESGKTLSFLNHDKFPDIKIDIINTFDNRLKESETIKTITDGAVETELDWEIYRIQKRYMSYQLEQGRRIITLLTHKASQSEIDNITGHKIRFFEIMDSLFIKTGKSINRGSDELTFNSRRGVITPYMLSSGEKQMLLILATVLTQDNAPAILFMDEPEISLHFDWQSRLIEDIRTLNPNVQLIMSTHSPAVIMNGWIANVKEISELIVMK